MGYFFYRNKYTKYFYTYLQVLEEFKNIVRDQSWIYLFFEINRAEFISRMNLDTLRNTRYVWWNDNASGARRRLYQTRVSRARHGR